MVIHPCTNMGLVVDGALLVRIRPRPHLPHSTCYTTPLQLGGVCVCVCVCVFANVPVVRVTIVMLLRVCLLLVVVDRCGMLSKNRLWHAGEGLAV